MTTETGSAPPLPIPRTLTVRELSDRLGVNAVQVIKVLMTNGIMADVSKILDFDTAALVAVDLGFEPVQAGEVVAEPSAPTTIDIFAADTPDNPAALRPRPPVIALLGHVDHGKTSLLDAIRQARVAAGEAGGITQHIGAYQVEIEGKAVTCLDTPGHEAFTQMRARGAEATDIAVLVVAADDGVMPQTVEAINHIHAAGVPLVVALTKIDLPNANPDRVKTQLTEHRVVIEEYGGDVPFVPVSSVTKQGIGDLLETILLLAEVHELKANPDGPANGVVLEAALDRRQGPRTTLLIKRGTLRLGDALLVGNTWGRVKAMFDFTGARLRSAGPSTPVAILGAEEVAQAGDRFRVMSSERLAKSVYESAKRAREAAEAQVRHATSLDALFGEIRTGAVHELNLILKTDVQGSGEPIRAALERLSNPEVRVKIIHGAPGAVTESDINLAVAARGIVVTFNTSVEPGARKLAEIEGVEIRSYTIIYKLLEEIEAAITGMLQPVVVEVLDAQAEVLQVFAIRRHGNIAGARSLEGTIRRDASVRVLREGQPVATGKIASLRRFQNDVKEVQPGQEFGVSLEGFDAFQPGDRLEFFHQERQSRAAPRPPAAQRA